MSRLSSAVLVLGLLAAVVWGARQGSSAAGGAVDADWVAQHKAQLRRVLDLPASVELDFKTASDTEYRRVVIDARTGRRRQPLELFVSRDGERVLYDGRAYELADPFRAIREEIELANQPTRGPADAPVTIVEYSDYTCPYCRQFYTTIERPLFERYSEQVRLVYKHFPLAGLRAWSDDAAVAGACAFRQNNDAFWAFHEKLFEQVARLKEGKPVLLELATEAGLDLEAFTTCLDQRDGLVDVVGDVREGERLGVEGTPTFFVNGRPIPGLVSPQRFFQIVDEELAAAQPH